MLVVRVCPRGDVRPMQGIAFDSPSNARLGLDCSSSNVNLLAIAVAAAVASCHCCLRVLLLLLLLLQEDAQFPAPPSRSVWQAGLGLGRALWQPVATGST